MSQAIVDGIMTGAVYAAYGIGLSLIFGVTRVISGVHGSFIVLGALMSYTAWHAWGVDPFISIPFLIVIGFAIGYVVQRAIVNRVLRRNILMTIMVTFGVNLCLITLMLIIWGTELHSVKLSYSADGTTILGVQLTYLRLGIFVAAILLAFGLDWVVKRTEMGRRIRAVSQDATAAELIGLDTDHYYGLAHGLAAAVAVAAGAFVLMQETVGPYAGWEILLLAFTVVVLAGFGSVAPVLLAGFVLGVASSVVGLELGPQYQELTLFAVYLLVATFRPSGLFGRSYYGH